MECRIGKKMETCATVWERSGWLWDASARRAAFLTASITSLVGPSSSMPPLLTTKWRQPTEITEGKSSVVMGIWHTLTAAHLEIYDCDLRRWLRQKSIFHTSPVSFTMENPANVFADVLLCSEKLQQQKPASQFASLTDHLELSASFKPPKNILDKGMEENSVSEWRMQLSLMSTQAAQMRMCLWGWCWGKQWKGVMLASLPNVSVYNQHTSMRREKERSDVPILNKVWFILKKTAGHKHLQVLHALQ